LRPRYRPPAAARPARFSPLARLLSGLALTAVLLPRLAAAQSLEFRAPASVYDPATPAVMRDLASRIIPVYHNDDRERYLTNLSALQLVAGSFRPAFSAQLELRRLHGGTERRPPADPALAYDLFAHAKALQAQYRLPFPQAFDLAFWETIPVFDNLDAYHVESWLEEAPSAYAAALQASFDRLRGRTRVSEREALVLIRQYVAFDAYRSFGPIVQGLVSLDDDRRYDIRDDVVIDTPGPGAVKALVVRPRSSSGLLTTLLQYRIAPGGYNEAIEAAAYGFASMVAFTPRIRMSLRTAEVIPFEHEGERARAVIGWIARQPWSDAQVGMYGNGYSGFVAWAAAKRLPPQLKAIATSDAMAPGIDFPMDRGIGLSSAYCWLEKIDRERNESAGAPAVGGGGLGPGARTGAAGVAAAGGTSPPAPGTRPWCRALEAKWYASGKPFRDLPYLAGRPSAVFGDWLQHPAYDWYWRRLVPTAQELSHLDIPVLSMTGYYTRGEAGTLFYFRRHYAHDPHADQTLLLGPYDRAELRAGRAETLVRGLRTDPAAVIDLRALELQWFSYLFLNEGKPALLAKRIDYEVMGADAWRHAEALDRLSRDRVRLYLGADAHGGSGLLTPREPAGRTPVRLLVDLARRRDGGEAAPRGLVTASVPLKDGVAFVSGPLPGGLEIAGRFACRLLVWTNKRDVDLGVSLYELLPAGSYLRLFAPAEALRASYLRDPGRRRLLAPGRVQWLAFTSRRLTAVRVPSGARLVMVLRVGKRPDREINYGSGGVVSEEWISAGRVPVRLSLLRGSYLELPITEGAAAPPAPVARH
jgi:predicted acyl esterase